MTIHSHPSGFDNFSNVDNKNDRALFHSISCWFDDDRPNGSAIMLPDGRIKARIVSHNGKFFPIGSVAVVGEEITIWKTKKVKSVGAAQRISQTFGKGTLGLLRQLKIGVVGCSGTGSVMVELLARNCIGHLVLVDPDTIEEKNLNRIVNAKKTDAAKNMPKVKALEKAIKQMGTGVSVTTHQSDTYDTSVIESLADCDVLFGCVDSATGRYHLDCIANAYFIPCFDVGVYLEADERGGISQADAVSHYVHPESQSLLSRGAYTAEQLTAEGWKRDDKEYYEKQVSDGYLEGIEEDQPAVLSVNMQAACLAFNDFISRIHQFRLDDNSEFQTQRFRLVHGCYLNDKNKEGVDPAFGKYLGMGEKSFLIQKLKNSSKEA